MGHLESMRAKIEGLRGSGAVAALERRWEDDPGRSNASPLMLGEPVALAGSYPAGGLADLYLAAGRARFGEILFLPESAFGAMDAIDAYGEPIDDRRRLRIGDVGEDAVLLDLDSGAVIVYWFNYFERGWDSGVLVECGSVAEFADTVAMGPGYAGLHGPRERQRTAWWDEDPWFAYLRETGLAGA